MENAVEPPGERVRLAVMGVGLIGRRHVEHVLSQPEAELTAIVDPNPAARDFAKGLEVAWFPDIAAMLGDRRPEGVIIATPNQAHVENGLACVAAGLPALVEKPIADDVAGAVRLVEAAEHAGIPLLVGHHRRHNPMVHRAREAIASGRLGQIVSVHGSCWFYKPDEYFEVSWRREAGAGPVFLNLIHDIDLLRHLCGDIASVQAIESNALRRNAVEETAVILLRFQSGALGTVNVSDTIVAPWSWEFTSGENPAYTRTPEFCYMIGGTRGSLTIPTLDLWQHQTRPSWWEPIAFERLSVDEEDPLGRQVRNLCRVIRGTERPVVSAREGLETLRVVAAVKEAAATGRSVVIAEEA